MAVYLKSLAPRDAPPAVSNTERLTQPAVLEMGRKVYVQQCVMCHGNEGKGATRRPIRRLRRTVDHDGDAGQPDTHGAEWRLPAGDAQGPRPHGMPPFLHILSDDEVAAVVTYIRVAWGNAGAPVTPAQVNELRKLLPE